VLIYGNIEIVRQDNTTGRRDTGEETIPDRCAHWSGTVPPPPVVLVDSLDRGRLVNSSELT